jgi:hypothetical protein
LHHIAQYVALVIEPPTRKSRPQTTANRKE